jgi:dual specificity tyrosine-phosphorylation-regulated kinase 1
MQKADSLGSSSIGERESATSTTSNNGGFDDDKNDYIIQEGELWNGIFQVTKVIGKGSFGQVVEALDLGKKEHVAIKIIKNRPSFTKQAFMEMRILRVLNTKDPKDARNTVRMRDHFFHRNHLCIVYEMLSFNLYEVLRKGGFQGLPLSLVRKFASQVLTNLVFLSSPDVQVIHCDIKPEKYENLTEMYIQSGAVSHRPCR